MVLVSNLPVIHPNDTHNSEIPGVFEHENDYYLESELNNSSIDAMEQSDNESEQYDNNSEQSDNTPFIPYEHSDDPDKYSSSEQSESDQYDYEDNFDFLVSVLSVMHANDTYNSEIPGVFEHETGYYLDSELNNSSVDAMEQYDNNSEQYDNESEQYDNHSEQSDNTSFIPSEHSDDPDKYSLSEQSESDQYDFNEYDMEVQ